MDFWFFRLRQIATLLKILSLLLDSERGVGPENLSGG